MRDQAAINEKIRLKALAWHAANEHPQAGKPGPKHSEETKKKIGERSRVNHVKLTDAQKRAHNVANVMRYAARKRNALLPTSDIGLIKRIYEHRPEGYDVDHIVSLSEGGPHHQDNLQYLPSYINRCVKNANRPYDESLVIRWQDVIPQ